MNIRAHLGVSQSKDSFFGQHSPERMPVDTYLLERWKAGFRVGRFARNEAAAIYVLCSIYRKRAGGIMLIGWNQEGREPEEHVSDLDH